MNKRISLIFTLIITTTNLCPAQDSLNVQRFSELPYWSGLKNFTIQGNYAYLITYEPGLTVLDISDPTNPIQIGYCRDIVRTEHVAVAGNYLYTISAGYKLSIVDISNPCNPVFLSDIAIGGQTVGIAYSDGYIFACKNYGTVKVIDVSLPTYPVIVSEWFSTNPYNAWDIEIEGHYAYLIFGYDLVVLDISDPYSLAEAGSCTLTEGRELDVSGDYVYVAADYNGLRIIDVSNPGDPFEAGYYNYDYSDARAIDVEGDIAYIGDRQWGIITANISNPMAIYGLGRFQDTDVTEIQCIGELCFIIDDNFTIIDCSDPARLNEVCSFTNRATLISLDISNDQAVIGPGTPGTGGIQTIDVSNPLNPVKQFSLDLMDSLGVVEAFSIDIFADLAFIAANYDGLMIVDISDPYSTNMTYSGGTSRAWDVSVDDYVAFIADQQGGLEILDCQNPYQPTLLSYTPLSDHTYAIDIQNNILYIIDSDYFSTYDVSSLTAPTFLDRIAIDSAGDLAVRNGYAYIATSTGIKICDVTNPGIILEVDIIPQHGVRALTLEHENLYVAYSSNNYPPEKGFKVYDISNPTSTFLTGFYIYSGYSDCYFNDIVILNEIAYVVEDQYFTIYDCSQAASADNTPNMNPTTDFVVPNVNPNPFNISTNISFTLPVVSIVKLEIFNTAGQNVMSQLTTSYHEKQLPAGAHHILFNAADLPSGVYICYLRATGWSKAAKMVLLK